MHNSFIQNDTLYLFTILICKQLTLNQLLQTQRRHLVYLERCYRPAALQGVIIQQIAIRKIAAVKTHSKVISLNSEKKGNMRYISKRW
jgi:hypothetical protein